VEELQNRGFNTALLIRTGDIDLALQQINDNKEEGEKVTLTFADKLSVLRNLITNEKFKDLDLKIWDCIVEEILKKDFVNKLLKEESNKQANETGQEK
jgi:hypothetical protein